MSPFRRDEEKRRNARNELGIPRLHRSTSLGSSRLHYNNSFSSSTSSSSFSNSYKIQLEAALTGSLRSDDSQSFHSHGYEEQRGGEDAIPVLAPLASDDEGDLEPFDSRDDIVVLESSRVYDEDEHALVDSQLQPSFRSSGTLRGRNKGLNRTFHSWREARRAKSSGGRLQTGANASRSMYDLRNGLNDDHSVSGSRRVMKKSHTANGPMGKSSRTTQSIQRELVRSGWLLKQSDVLKQWKRRYFILIKRVNRITGQQMASLQYYKGSKFGKMRGEINLNEGPVTVRFVSASEAKRQHCFEVTRGGYSILCQAADEDDVSAWVCLLKDLIDLSNDPMSRRRASRTILVSSTRNTRTPDTGRIKIVAELRKLLHHEKSMEAIECKNFVTNLDFQEPSPLLKIREFHLSMTESIFKEHGSRILELILPSMSSSEELDQGKQALLETEIRDSIASHVEEALFLPLQEQIRSYLRKQHYESDSTLNRKLRWLQGKDQTYFNIPLHQVNLGEWQNAQRILTQITTQVLPKAKFDVIVETIEEIQSSYLAEFPTIASLSKGDTTESTRTLDEHSDSADSLSSFEELHDVVEARNALEVEDIVPIFTYVLAHAGLENLMSLKDILTELNYAFSSKCEENRPTSTDSTIGNSMSSNGFSHSPNDILSIFNEALEFVSNVSIPAVLEDIFRDLLTLSIDGDWTRVLDFEVEPTHRYGAIVRYVSAQGYSAFGTSVSRGSVLVTINGQNVVLWPFEDIKKMLQQSSKPHRFAFIPNSSYFKILTSSKSLWNVALLHACQRGDLANVQMLVSNGADVNYVADECGGNTPLQVAVSALHYNVTSYLLQNGAKVNILGEHGRNALHMIGAPCCMPTVSTAGASRMTTVATTNGSARFSDSIGSSLDHQSVRYKVINLVRKLLDYGVELEATDFYGNTPLMLLAQNGCLPGIDALIEAKPNLHLNARNWYRGMTALAFAAQEGHYDIVQALLRYGADCHLKTLRGESPLHFAAGIAHTRICNSLIDRGCQVDVRRKDGVTPLMVAVAKGKLPYLGNGSTSASGSIAGRWLNKQAGDDPVVYMDDSSVLETIELLINRGANTSSVCALFRSPIQYAVLYGGAQVLQYFVDRFGVDFKARDLFGMTILSLAEHAYSASSNGGSNVRGTFVDREPEKMMRLLDSHASSDCTKRWQQEKLENEKFENEVVTEKKEDGSAEVEIIAGNLEAILRSLLRYECYRVEDVEALVWSCDPYLRPVQMLEYLKNVLHQTMLTSTGSERDAYKKIYTRRMALHVLTKFAERLKHQVVQDVELRNGLKEFCLDILPLDASEDPQCVEWMRLCPLLTEFIELPQEFEIISYCEEEYAEVTRFLQEVREKTSLLKFLDNDLFPANSPALHKRLEVAGLNKESNIKPERTQSADPPQEIADNSSSSLDILPPPRRRGSSWATASSIVSSSLSASLSGLPMSMAGSFIGKPFSSSGLSPPTSAPELDPVAGLWIANVDHNVTAQQISLVQHYFFRKIKISEVLTSKKDAQLTPAYDRVRLLHNHISIWVVSQILSRDSVEERAALLAYFVRVAGACLGPLQNFDGFMAVMNAINDSSVFRLKKTWGRLAPQARDLWYELKKYTENGARPLHKLLKKAKPPCIPYMGIVLQNVIGLKEFPDHVEADLINFKKIRSIGSLIEMLLPHQKTPYLLDTNRRVLEQLCLRLEYPDIDSCFKRSLKVEPRIKATTTNAVSSSSTTSTRR